MNEYGTGPWSILYRIPGYPKTNIRRFATRQDMDQFLRRNKIEVVNVAHEGAIA